MCMMSVGTLYAQESADEEQNLFSSWEINLESAIETVQQDEEAQFVFLYFAGTDWCPWCMKFEREILDTRLFRNFLDDGFVPVLIDFPRTRELPEEQVAYNQQLSNTFGVEGFPSLFILDNEEKIVYSGGYQTGGPRRYISNIRKALR